jgi:hypothetical protein
MCKNDLSTLHEQAVFSSLILRFPKTMFTGIKTNLVCVLQRMKRNSPAGRNNLIHQASLYFLVQVMHFFALCITAIFCPIKRWTMPSRHLTALSKNM